MAATEQAKHTAGPWSFDAMCFDRKIPIRGGVTAYGRPYTIAHVNRPGSAYAGQDKANARLIAAAPELLGHLKFAVKMLSAFPGFSGTAQVEAMQAAIARAEAA